MGQDRNFSRQDNSRQRQNLETQDKTTSDGHIAVKTIQDFQVIKNFGSRQVKNFNFSKFTRQDRSRQDSCQEIVKKNSRNGLFLTDFGSEF